MTEESSSFRSMIRKVRYLIAERRVRREVVGKCPDCGEIIRDDEHGRRVPPNPLSGREHMPGKHYVCPNRFGFPVHSDDHQDLREYDLDSVTEEEVKRKIQEELS